MDIRLIVKNILLFFSFIFLLLVIFLGLRWFSNNFYEFFEKKVALKQQNFLASVNGDNLEELSVPLNLLPSRNWVIGELELDVEAAISVETNLLADDKILFKKDENKILPIASLLKLMTALIVLDNYNLSKSTIVSQNAVFQEGEQGGLVAGETLSIKNLLYIMLIESSNDAACCLAEIMGQEKFVGLMNREAKNIGLENTYFADSSGLDDKSYSTAKDLVILAKHLLNKYPLALDIMGTKEHNLYLDDGRFHHKLINTNKLLGEIPEVVGGKTGFTKIAKGTFLVVSKSPLERNYLIHVILGSDDRLEEMKKIINWLNIAYDWQL